MGVVKFVDFKLFKCHPPGKCAEANTIHFLSENAMSQTATILKMKSLGFTMDQIAAQLGLSLGQLRELIRENEYSLKKEAGTRRSNQQAKRKDRLPLKRKTESAARVIPVQETPPSILEVKPGFYVLTAEDLVRFAGSLQEQRTAPPDPFEDYVQKDVFQKQYGISDTTLQRHQKEGLLVVYKLGNKQYLRKSQVVEALEKGKL